MKEEGLPSAKIIEILDDKIGNDCDFTSGRILGSMCTRPLDLAREIYAKYIQINVGDKGISPNTAKLEEELIAQIAQLFHGKNIVGNLVSGGTEGNIIAMRIARKLRPRIKHPEIIASEEAHLSFEKVADLMGAKIIKAELNPDYTLNVDDIKKKITKNTCGLIGIAGTTGLGLVDPIEELGEIALEHQLYLHIDAAFGGFILPFMEQLGHSINKWDFSVEGVDSISADPHKMGMSVIPGGSFLIREKDILEELIFEIPYLAGGAFTHFNLLGTRPGAAIIAFWATMNYLGKSGYKEVVKQCLEVTAHASEQLNKSKNFKLVIDPPMNVVGITKRDNSDITSLNVKLKEKNWHLGEFKKYNFLRIVCMPHVKKEHIDDFMKDLNELS